MIANSTAGPTRRCRSGWILGLAVAVLSLLLVSAGGRRQVSGEASPASVAAPGERWAQLLMAMAEELPGEHRASWREEATRHPRLFLMAGTTILTRADAASVPPPGEEIVRP